VVVPHTAFGPDNFRRLVAVKDAYDPENVFRLNQNIEPSGPSAKETVDATQREFGHDVT
jgi:hypothetical protein